MYRYTLTICLSAALHLAIGVTMRPIMQHKAHNTGAALHLCAKIVGWVYIYICLVGLLCARAVCIYMEQSFGSCLSLAKAAARVQ
jgi:lipoprotein signal peptidase